MTETKALTSNHVLDEEFTEIVLTKFLNVDKNGAMFIGEHAVSINMIRVAYNVDEDWAVLVRNDKSFFKLYISVCWDVARLSSKFDDEIDIFHAPLGLSVDQGLKEIRIWKQSTHLLQYDNDQKEAIFDFGRVKGSCGAPYVTSSGEALAFHTESFNEYKADLKSEMITNQELSQLSKRNLNKLNKTSPSMLEVTQDIIAIKESSGSVHANFSRGVVIPTHSALMMALQANKQVSMPTNDMI